MLDKKDARYQINIKNSAGSMRIFTVDLKDNIVYCFSRNNIADKRVMTMESFYQMFHENDVTKVKTWLKSISLNNESVGTFLEVDTINAGSNKNSFSLMKLVKYNDEERLIHLELQVLKYVVPSNLDRKRLTYKAQNNCRVTLGTMTQTINKSRSTKGFTFSIRFTYVNQGFEQNEQERLMVIKIKDQLYPLIFSSSHRKLIEINAREILIVDLSITDGKEAWALAKMMLAVIHKAMQLEAIEQFLKLSIGIVENKSFYRDFTSIVKHAQEASLSAVKDGREICVYEKTVKPDFVDERNNAEIDNLIQNNQLRYLFRPICDVKNRKVLGYLHIIKPYNSPFTTYNEIIHYAYDCGRSKDVFTLVAKNVIPRYADEVPKAKTPLFYPTSILDFENIQTILPQITRVERTRLVLVFEENEISQNNAHLKELSNSLNTLKLQGVELALSMMDKNLLLDPTFYRIFDYFVVGSSISGEVKKNNAVRMGLRTLIESLLKYKRPIIATGLDGWQAVELMVKSGVNFVSSEAISPSNEMVVPVDKKKFDKLTDFIR